MRRVQPPVSCTGTEGRRTVTPRLGRARHVVSVPEGALAPSAHHQCGGVAVCIRPAPDDGGQAVQPRGVSHGPHLKSLAGRGAELPAPECAGVVAPGLCRGPYVDGKKQTSEVIQQEVAARSHLHTY